MKALVAVLLVLPLLGQASAAADRNPTSMEWNVGGVKRQALVFLPAKRTPHPPLVFGFHGHGGNALFAARSFQLQKLWPEAVVVYMQGLPTPSKIDPDGKQNGWQGKEGDQDDRDLKFFDVVLEAMKTKGKIDPQRIYATGHSNGGFFTYLLWGARPDTFAAVAPSAAFARNVSALTPLPCMHIAGEKDETVPFKFQQRSMEAVRKVNLCAAEGKPWAPGCTLYPSEKGAPFVACIHGGTHAYPEQAPRLIVKFFQEHHREPPAGEKK